MTTYVLMVWVILKGSTIPQFKFFNTDNAVDCKSTGQKIMREFKSKEKKHKRLKAYDYECVVITEDNSI